jgi:hypothetical protein
MDYILMKIGMGILNFHSGKHLLRSDTNALDSSLLSKCSPCSHLIVKPVAIFDYIYLIFTGEMVMSSEKSLLQRWENLWTS